MEKMNRAKIYERSILSNEDKKAILNKSNGLCCHCGRRISFADKTATVDHAIPISKGGSDSLSNKIALCQECNIEKGNDIICSSYYFKFLKYEYMEKLLHTMTRYFDEFNWVSRKSFLPSDSISTMTVNIHNKLSFKMTFKKAVYSDLDDVYYFLLKYVKKFYPDKSATEAKNWVHDSIVDTFENGCYYIGYKACGDICIVLPVVIHKWNGDDCSRLVIGDPAILYNKFEYCYALSKFLNLILKGIFDSTDCDMLSAILTCRKGDSVSEIAFSSLGNAEVVFSEDDTTVYESVVVSDTADESIGYSEYLKRFSDFLESLPNEC